MEKNPFILFIPLLLILTVSILPVQEESLLSLIEKEAWDQIGSKFEDQSYRPLKHFFQNASLLKLIQSSETEILYKAKFGQYAEMGFLVYKKKDGRYSQLAIANQIKPLLYINEIREYHAKNIRLKLGDGEVELIEGSLYECLPHLSHGTFFFEGKWRFEIRPSDEEERLTLLRSFKNETFIRNEKTGFFILQDIEFLQNCSPGRTLREFPPDSDLFPLFDFYFEYFGLQVEDFNEKWYLSVLDQENVIVFPKDRKSVFFYDFNPESAPDTQLRSTIDNRVYLNYNSITVPKLVLSKPENMKEAKLNLYFNPRDSFFSGTSTIHFDNKATFRSLKLNKSLTIKDVTTGEFEKVNILRRGEGYFASFPESDKLSFYFKGSMQSDEEYPDLIRVIFHGSMQKVVDDHYLISRNQNFFPNTGGGFYESSIKISLPDEYECVATGKKESSKSHLGRHNVHYTSNGTKGIAFICGDFKEQYRVDSKIPLRVFYTPDFRVRRIFRNDEMKSMMNYLVSLYGMLDWPEVNLVIRRWLDDGGLSNTGFVILNVMQPAQNILDYTARLYQRDSPVILTQNRNDFLLHELAHQWWGGIVSWATYRDEWITEGLAHFSNMMYLRETLSEKQFLNLMDRQLRFIMKYSEAGPVTYGKRIANLEDYDAYQSIIYNKSALILMMLRDLLGNDLFFDRLRMLLQKNKYKNITTSRWIRHMAEDSPQVEKFLKKWLYSRKIPNVTYSYSQTEANVNLHIQQQETDFVFPLWVELSTTQETTTHMIIVDSPVKDIPINFIGELKSLRVEPRYSPVSLRSQIPQA